MRVNFQHAGILSPHIVDCLANAKTGQDYLAALSSVWDDPICSWGAASVPELQPFDLPPTLHLPAYHDVRPLLQTYFMTANSSMPVYCESDFMRLVEMMYTHHLPPSTPVIASIHVLLAIAHHRRASEASSSSEDMHRACHHFEQASALLPKLMLEYPCLTSIQAMLGMVRIVTPFSSER